MSLHLDNDEAERIRRNVSGQMARAESDLADLVRIPSINFPGYDRAPVLNCAHAIADLFDDAGATHVETLTGESGVPTVRADLAGPPGAPTVLLYSHYDVQPAGDTEKWKSPAFEPTIRDGRMYGRGAADDKSGVIAHLTCLRAISENPPIGLRILIEGEEENGGDFEEWPTANPQAFAGLDAAVINDMGGVELGIPTFTTELRGIAQGVVTIRTLPGPVHSGLFGGPTPNALTAMIKLLSTLTDDNDDCAIAGIPGGTWDGADVSEDLFRTLAGIDPKAHLVGTGSIADRLITKPAVSIVGIDAPSVDTAATAIVPEARAKISVRIPAGADWKEATAAIAQHIAENTPWGIEANFVPNMGAAGTRLNTHNDPYRVYSAAMATAFGRDAVRQGAGGSIPFVANLVAAFPDLPVIATGAQDPTASIHAPNESVDLSELLRTATAETLFVAGLGATASERVR